MTLKEKNMLAVIIGCVVYVLAWVVDAIIAQMYGVMQIINTTTEIMFFGLSIFVTLTFMAYNLDEEYRG